MRNSLKTTAGFLAAATLLGGSAFAFAPEFDGDLPTVIITDRGDTPGSDFDPEAYNFRFSDAFNLLDYIDLRGNQESDLKYLFNEFYFDGVDISSVPNHRDDGVLTINTNRSFYTGGDIVPAPEDFSSAAPVLRPEDETGLLTFRNRDFSGDDPNQNTDWDNIGNVTGYDIDASGPQQRVVSLYLKGEPNEGIDVGSFLVITARDSDYGWDQITDPLDVVTDPFDGNEVAEWDDDFGGWNAAFIESPISPLDRLAEGSEDTRVFHPTAGTLSPTNVSFGFSTTGGNVSAGAEQLDFGVSSANSGWSFVTALSPAVAVDANKIYRVRTNWYSTSASSTERVRIRFGDLNVGGVEFEYTDSDKLFPGAPTLPTVETTQNVYVVTKAAGNTTVAYDIITEGASGQDLVITSLAVSSADRSELGSPAVLFNRGGTVPTLAAGEFPDPPANPDAFQPVGTTPVYGETVETVGIIPNDLPISFNVSGSAVTFNVPTQTSGDLKAGGLAASGGTPYTAASPVTSGIAAPAFGRVSFSVENLLDPESDGSFTAEDGKLYIVDFYVTTSTSNPVPAGTQPVQLRANTQIAAGKGWLTTYAVGGSNPVSASSEAKVYSVVVNSEDGEAVVSADFLVFRGQFPSGSPAQSYTIHRIVANEYEEP